MAYFSEVEFKVNFGLKGTDQFKAASLHRNSTSGLCLQKPGTYEFIMENNYVILNEFPSGTIIYDTYNPRFMNITVDKYRVKGELRFKSEEDADRVDEIGIEVGGHKFLDYDYEDISWEKYWKHYEVFIPAKLVHDNDYTLSMSVFPIIDRMADSESDLVFKPSEHEVTFSPANKPAVGGNFKVIPGNIIRGQITPPLADCEVTIRRETTKKIKVADPVVIYTDSKGQFRYGPVETDDYVVSVAKNDYVFTETKPFHFTAKKTPKLDVLVSDSEGKPLESVFVTASAGTTFLKATTNAEGVAKFSDLVPGTYYLTAILKEYQFGRSNPVVIADEEHGLASLVGDRIAFSVYGRL